MTTAFVLSGGASHGAVQVGMLQALAERKVRPDLVFGASAGALNAAWVAGDPGLENLDALVGVWRSLRARDVFPLRPITGLLGFLGRRDALSSAAGLRGVVSRNLRFERIEDAPIPLCVVATEVTSGREVALTTGDALRRDHRQRFDTGSPPTGRRRRNHADGRWRREQHADLERDRRRSDARLRAPDRIRVRPPARAA